MFVLHLNSYTISIVNVGLSVVWRDWSTWVYNPTYDSLPHFLVR